MTIRIIASGAYVSQELSAEFGQIPPAFLPVGVKRLYEYQAAVFGVDHEIFLTVPDSFVIQPHDRQKLEELRISIIPVPEDLSLGHSLVYALNYIAAPAGSVRLLHGDTLLDTLLTDDDDVISVQSEGDDYSWAAVRLSGDSVLGLDVIEAGTPHDHRPVACGYFTFSSSSVLAQCLTRARGDFVAGLNLYCDRHEVSASFAANWYDFGHIQTYFSSRRSISTARSFNALHITKTRVRKSSIARDKMLAEAAWLGNIPVSAKVYAARLLDSNFSDGISYYDTEYQYCPTLSELYVFSTLGKSTWRKVLSSCAEFISICGEHQGPGDGDVHLHHLALEKTSDRLEQYARDTGFKISAPTSFAGRPMPSLVEVAEQIAPLIDLKSGRRETLMHGDFCFSNIFYNSRAGRIVVIDPRGYVKAGVPTIFGDVRYDLAKLNHSVFGHYDHILAGRYSLEVEGERRFDIQFEASPNHTWLVDAVSELEAVGTRLGSQEIMAITVSLFISMLPLHADRPDRQSAFIANALRLYQSIEGMRA